MNYPEDITFTNLIPKEWLSFIDENTLYNTNELLKQEILKCKKSIYEIYPYHLNDIFKVFNLTKLQDIKVVIIGQDPYHSNKFQANGIAFSVNKGVSIPPSLRNILKELNYNCVNSDLSKWVEQGVFLLNTSLTVKQKHPNSHANIWNKFTDHIIDIISKNCKNVIFVAWGSYALEKFKNIDKSKHNLLFSSHPSPLSCYKTQFPFIGSKIFLKINEILKNKNLKEINW